MSPSVLRCLLAMTREPMRCAGKGQQSPKNETTNKNKAPRKLRPETGHSWRGIMNDSCVPSLPANKP